MAKIKPMAVKKMPVNKPAMPKITSANAMGKSGTFLQNVNVRPTRLQTAVHDAKAYSKMAVGDIKNNTHQTKADSKKIGNKAKAIGGAALALANAPAVLLNVASGQARYNKNKRAGVERPDYLKSVGRRQTMSDSGSMAKDDSLLATQGKLSGWSDDTRDKPLPSSDGILKNAVNKLSDLIKR